MNAPSASHTLEDQKDEYRNDRRHTGTTPAPAKPTLAASHNLIMGTAIMTTSGGMCVAAEV